MYELFNDWRNLLIYISFFKYVKLKRTEMLWDLILVTFAQKTL